MNTDVQNYMGVLSQVNFSKELINERVQTELQKNEAIMPFSELALGESGKIILEKGVEFAKEAGVNAVKNFARGKMQEAGIDNDTINTILEGDLTNLSKVSSLINVGKQKALDIAKAKMKEAGVDDDTANSILKGDFNQAVKAKVEGVIGEAKDIAKTKMQEAGVDDDTINSILKGDFNQAVKAKVDEAISKAKDIKSQVSDTIDNVGDDLKQTIATSQGVADDLKAQAMQEYNSFRIDAGDMPTLMENEGFLSGIGNRIMNTFTRQAPPPQPEDVELVDMASLPPKAPVITTATDTAVDTGADIAGGVADIAVEAGIGEILGPIGLIGGLIGGIIGIVEGEKKPQVPQGILNPSEQFL